MSPEEALAANPDDEDCWKRYGDHLLTQGGPRAELVRLERSLAETTSVRDQRSLKRSLKAIHTEQQPTWLSGLSFPDHIALRWRYGLITGIRAPGRLASSIDPLAALDTARFLSSIHLDDIDHDSVIPALRAAALRPIRSLTLVGETSRLGTRGARVVARAESLRKVTSLNLVGNSIGVEGAREIAESEHIRAMLDLDLGWNDIGDKGAVAIAQSSALAALRSLKLHANGISNVGAEELARSTHLRALRSLDLRSNNIDRQGAIALLRSETLRNLGLLDLGSNLRIEDKDITTITQNSLLPASAVRW